MSDSEAYINKEKGVYVFENPTVCIGEYGQNCIKLYTRTEAEEYIMDAGFENATIEEIL